MLDKNEMFNSTTPKNDIVCKDCVHRLRPVTVAGKEIKRHTYGTCGMYENKPSGILWDGDKCDFYEKE